VISAFFVMHCVSLVVAFVLRLCLYDVLCFWSLSLPWEREREREKSEMWNEDKTRLPLGSPYNYYNNPSCRPWMTREHRCFSPSCLGSLSLLCPPPIPSWSTVFIIYHQMWFLRVCCRPSCVPEASLCVWFLPLDRSGELKPPVCDVRIWSLKKSFLLLLSSPPSLCAWSTVLLSPTIIHMRT